MALRLKRMTGIDPLTVDQTTFRSPIDVPVVCDLHRPSDKERADLTDLAIALPAPIFVDSRPTWRTARGEKQTPVPAELRTKGQVVIVEARYADEPDDATPADRVLLRVGETVPLLLPKGRFRARAWTGAHGWTQEVVITVD
jgi:hypothetical protein